jgi:broad specificity phosphatase PhoE
MAIKDSATVKMETRMATEVFLVRHGQTNANVDEYYMGWSNEDLNELGYHQAYCLSSRLAGLPVAAIYTSPLKRARTTASIIAEPHELEVQSLADFVEIQLGDWQGMHREEIKRKWPELWRQSRIDPSDLRLPNGESYREVTERAVRGFKTTAEAHKDNQIVIVTHDAIIKVLIAHVLGVSNSIYRRIEVDNASLTLIRVSNRAQLVRLNDTSHLQC